MAPSPAEAAPAAQRAARVDRGQGGLHHQHDPGRAGSRRGVHRAGQAARQPRRGRPDHGHLHRVRVRLADPAAARVRPGRHAGPGHAGPVPAADPHARGRPAGRVGHRRVAAGHLPRPARGHRRAGPRTGRPAHRGARGAAGGAVLPHAGAVRHHGPGRAAALAPRQGLRGPADHPDLRPVRGVRADRAQADRRGQDHGGELRRGGRMAALDTAGPGRARDSGRLGRAPGHRAAAAGAADRPHRRARPAVDPLSRPGPGDGRHHHAVSGGARRDAAAGPVRRARRGGGPVLDLPAARTRPGRLLGHRRGHHGGHVRQHDPDPGLSRRAVPQRGAGTRPSSASCAPTRSG